MPKTRRFRTPLDSEHVKRPKHCLNLGDSSFSYFSTSLREVDSEKFSVSNMLNLRALC